LRGGEQRLAVRINGLRTAEGLLDLLSIRELRPLPPLIFIPSVESAAEIRIARAVLGAEEAAIAPLIESTAGLRAAHEVAAAPGVAAVMFGGGDLASELGVELAWEPLAVARAHFVLACAGTDVSIIDVPFTALDDEAGLQEETARAKALGFSAKAAIHPSQLETIASVFRPTEAEVAEAQEAIQAFRAAGGKAIRHAGRMLEAPLVRRFEVILSRAGEA
jgi:citrate lyase beta subunit